MTIVSKMVDLDGKPFEVYLCGDQTSDKLALFLHGFPECAYEWRHQMKLLADMGYKCWAPNLRGYGKSYSPLKVSDYHIDNLSNDVAELIDAAGCKSVTLISHDWGGALAWNIAIQKIRPLDRLVVMNMPHPALFLKELRKWRQMKKSWYMFFFQIPKLPEYIMTKDEGKTFTRFLRSAVFRKNTFTPEDLEVYKRNALLRPGGMTAMLNWYRSLFRNTNSINKTLSTYLNEKIQVPTLLIWGEQDVALGIYTTLGTEKYVKDFTICYIPDAGHFVQEESPEETNAILKAWLEGKKVPGSSKPSIYT